MHHADWQCKKSTEVSSEGYTPTEDPSKGHTSVWSTIRLQKGFVATTAIPLTLCGAGLHTVSTVRRSELSLESI